MLLYSTDKYLNTMFAFNKFQINFCKEHHINNHLISLVVFYQKSILFLFTAIVYALFKSHLDLEYPHSRNLLYNIFGYYRKASHLFFKKRGHSKWWLTTTLVTDRFHIIHLLKGSFGSNCLSYMHLKDKKVLTLKPQRVFIRTSLSTPGYGGVSFGSGNRKSRWFCSYVAKISSPVAKYRTHYAQVKWRKYHNI